MKMFKMKKINAEDIAISIFNVMVFIMILPLLIICVPIALLKR